MVGEWVRGAEEAQREVIRQIADLPVPPHDVTTAVGYGHDWADALDDVEWRAGDVLVVGSSSAGPAARVFLGSHGSKIVRHAPVPVVVVPRSAVADLLDS